MASSKTAPSTKFTREELLAFAQAGVRERVREMEREIVRLQQQFPEVMITSTIALLKPERRTDGQSWPALPKPSTTNTNRVDAVKAAWTPARRKRQAALMKKRSAKMHAARRAAVKRAKKSGDGYVWQKMQAALLAAPDHRATSKELQQATGSNSVAIANSFNEHDDIFRRVGQGVYSLTAAGKKAAENGATAE